jgi:hypothetical protein
MRAALTQIKNTKTLELLPQVALHERHQFKKGFRALGQFTDLTLFDPVQVLLFIGFAGHWWWFCDCNKATKKVLGCKFV